MKRNVALLVVFGLLGTMLGIRNFEKHDPVATSLFVSCVVDPKKQNVQLYWKDEQGEHFGSILNLKTWLAKRSRKLTFAMNAGMYKPDHSAQGLYIENYKTIAPLDTASAAGNFYLKPNGVFCISNDGSPAICTTQQFHDNGQIKYATQSGPMLLIAGHLHPAFKKNSTNLTIRNGVGILPNNKVVFVMSKKAISFYDFAKYFQELGCRNALYLDGLVSRTYLPEKQWIQTDGDFGVIVGVTTELK